MMDRAVAWRGGPILVALLVSGAWAGAAPTVAEEWKKEIKPILSDYCYDCHGDGASKGDLVMDEFGSLEEHLDDHHLWLQVWRNVRSQLMPPAKKMQPEQGEREQLLRWIERRVFRLDPQNPDPGRVTIRRLNREEYRNTVRDLLGVDYDTRENFPPDDTGYGFDTIGDVLSLSPLLLEKYVRAAEEVAGQAMPLEAAKTPELVIQAGEMKQPGKESYRTVMMDGPAPDGAAARRKYAEKIFRRFAQRAYRRPVDDWTVGRLADMVLAYDAEEGKSFEDGVRLGVTAVLASPRFLFRAEVQPEADNPSKVVPVDEYALASRLSYFLWSSMPDDELFRLATQGELRRNLDRQVERMLADEKSVRFVRNFTGQWLQARDVESVHVNAKSILQMRRTRDAQRVFHSGLREDMRRETEMLFGHVLRKGLPATELLTARYGFLNESLAKFYKVDGVKGDQFRLVKFDDDDHRGGVLAQGTFLVVTSNPTRTSPVKRGLFVLDNILGTPAPPAPPGVPTLEEVAKEAGQPLTMREAMVRHREDPLCKSCHARMDPIGLALENYNALGMWRDEEGGKPIDTAGQLVTGEKFGSLEELKKVLGTSRRRDFHRCLAEKLMTYALGRGVEYYDAPSIDAIVADAEKAGGSLKEFVKGVVRTAAFQKRRGDG